MPKDCVWQICEEETMKRAFWYEKDFEELIPETDDPGSEDSAIDFREN